MPVTTLYYSSGAMFTREGYRRLYGSALLSMLSLFRKREPNRNIRVLLAKSFRAHGRHETVR